MRTTIDLPDPVYRRLKARAALEGASVKDVLLRIVQRELAGHAVARRTAFPLIRGKETRLLDLGNDQIEQILFG